jgi:hypothetical protein
MRCGISFHVLSKLELLLSVLSGNAYLSPPIVLTAPSQIFCGIIFQPGIEISSTATDQVSCNCLEFRKKNAESLVISIPTCGVACLPQGYFLGVRTTPSNGTNTQLSSCPRPPTISYGSFEYVQAARRGYILSQHTQDTEHTTSSTNHNIHAQDKITTTHLLTTHPRIQEPCLPTLPSPPRQSPRQPRRDSRQPQPLSSLQHDAPPPRHRSRHLRPRLPPTPQPLRKPLPPKAPELVPATKTPKPVCAPRTSAERLSPTPEPLATSTPRDLLALLEHCRRKIVQRVQVLRQRGQLPSRFRRTIGQDLLEGVVSYDGYEAACDSKLVFLVARYKAIKAQLDAPVNPRR